jgi:hypothetical protein
MYVVLEAKEEFWDRWVQEIFPSLLRQKRWCTYKRDVRVGDVVPQQDATADGQSYDARVTKVHEGPDGKVQSADVEYKVQGESKFRMTTRLIHKLVLVIPVEEQTVEDVGKP